MDKKTLVQKIGNEICDGCGPDADCGLDPCECERIINAVALLEAFLKETTLARGA